MKYFLFVQFECSGDPVYLSFEFIMSDDVQSKIDELLTANKNLKVDNFTLIHGYSLNLVPEEIVTRIKIDN